MRSARLQLENYFVEELLFQIRPSEKLANSKRLGLFPSDLRIAVALGENKSDSLKKLCRLTIGLTDKKKDTLPYSFKIDLVGFFKLDPECSEELKEALIKINAPSLLFTAARELLLLISSRSAYGPLMLPTVAFPQIKTKSRSKPTESRISTTKVSAARSRKKELKN